MLFRAGLPTFLWAEAIHHAAWLWARIPSWALPGCTTPIERATRQKPNLKRVLVFGALVWVKVKNAGKLDPQAIEGNFVGYDEESKGYHVYFPKRRSVIIEHDVYFNGEAAVEVGEVVFEGGSKEPMAEAKFSNPTVPTEVATSAPSFTDENVPEPESKSLDFSDSLKITKPR